MFRFSSNYKIRIVSFEFSLFVLGYLLKLINIRPKRVQKKTAESELRGEFRLQLSFITPQGEKKDGKCCKSVGEEEVSGKIKTELLDDRVPGCAKNLYAFRMFLKIRLILY